MVGIGALGGQFLLSYLLKKYRKMSILVFLVGVVLIVSVIMLAYTGIRSMVVDGFGPFKSLCAAP